MPADFAEALRSLKARQKAVQSIQHFWAIQPAEQSAELVSRQPSQLALC